MRCLPHDWRETGKRDNHATDEVVIYVRCARCKQLGFRRNLVAPRWGGPSRVVYTWEPQGES